MVNLAVALILSQEAIATDPRLTERVGFDYSLTPLAKFVEIARAASRVPLSIDPSLEYLKVDAFVDDEPIGATLSKLSEVFNLEWQREGNGYKLVPKKATSDQQKAYIADEENQVIKVVDHDIAVYREIDRLVPKSKKPWPRIGNRFLGWDVARNRAHEDLERAQENKVAADRIELLEVKYDALKQISDGLPNLQMARLFGQMNTGDITQLRNGLPFIASNEAKSRFHYSLGDIRPNPDMPFNTSVKSVLIVRIDPESHRVGGKEMTYLGKTTGMAAQPASHYPFEDISPVLSKQPFAVSLNAWDQTKDLQTLFVDPFKVEPNDEIGDPSPWYEKRQRLGDHLRWFHRVTRVPVIAPADRIAHPFLKSYKQAKSQGEYLTKLLKACNGFGRKSDHFLLVRDGVFWRKSADELPENVLARYERPTKGKLKFADYSELAGNISHTQAMLLEDSKGFVLTFPRFRFAEAYPAYKFLNCLDEEQIDSAFNPRKGLNYQTLSPAQQNQFAQCVVDGIVGRGIISDSMLNNLVVTGVIFNTLHGMRFGARTHTMPFANYASETVEENGQEIELAPKRVFANRPSINFSFETPDKVSNLTFITEDLGF